MGTTYWTQLCKFCLWLWTHMKHVGWILFHDPAPLALIVMIPLTLFLSYMGYRDIKNVNQRLNDILERVAMMQVQNRLLVDAERERIQARIARLEKEIYVDVNMELEKQKNRKPITVEALWSIRRDAAINKRLTELETRVLKIEGPR